MFGLSNSGGSLPAKCCTYWVNSASVKNEIIFFKRLHLIRMRLLLGWLSFLLLALTIGFLKWIEVSSAVLGIIVPTLLVSWLVFVIYCMWTNQMLICARCGKHFYWTLFWGNPFSSKCLSCGLEDPNNLMASKRRKKKR